MRRDTALVLLLALVAAPPLARGDVSHVMHSRDDERGAAVHAVPLWNSQVRMVAERVVLVPFYDAKTYQPRLLCHVWYDLLNEGPTVRLEVGFPELKAYFGESVLHTMAMAHTLSRVDQKWTLPTIIAFAARQGGRELPSRAYPGVGRYRQWYTFGVDLPAGKTIRLHTTYLATLGSNMIKPERHEDDPRATTHYHLHYILHTGALWRGPIGRGEVLLYDRGRLRTLRRFTELEPTLKDDLHVSLDLMVDLAHDREPEEVAEGEFAHRNLPGNRLDRKRILSASSTLESPRIDTHVGLLVDGDAETRWVSAKGRGVGARLELPSNPEKDLTELRVTGGASGDGVTRPSRLKVFCQKGWRRTELASPELPDDKGPHVVTLAKPARCDALRVDVVALHGERTASVAIAELEQRFADDDPTKDPPHTNRSKGPPSDPFKPSDRGPGSKDYPLPAAADPRAFEMAGVERVSFSGDGTLLHYQFQLEDLRQNPRGLRLGIFVDVATGKPIRAYRMDRHGELPEPYGTLWEQAMSFEEGADVLARHEFTDAVTTLAPPRKSSFKSQRLRLLGSAKDEPGALRVTPSRHGFTWRYVSQPSRAEGTAQASLELRHEAKGQPESLLASRAPMIDRTFAVRHQATWQARKAIFEKAVKEYLEHLERNGVDSEVKPEDAPKWHALTYRHVRAYSGEARVFWHPQGEALAVFWMDIQDHSALSKDPEPEHVTPSCAELQGIHVCPWERLDDPRHLVAMTVHALSPRASTTLLKPYEPPPAKPPSTTPDGEKAAGGDKGASEAVAVPLGAREKKDPGSGASSKPGGCGCAGTAADGTDLLPVMLAWMLVGLLRRRRKEIP